MMKVERDSKGRGLSELHLARPMAAQSMMSLYLRKYR
jgi:hypothetical protein